MLWSPNGGCAWSCALLGAAVWLVSPSAVAQSADSASAESMFEQGRDLLRAGKVDEACPKLAESQRLEPASGTLLALALCYEAEGRLASAWSAFVEVEARSRRENRADREQVAHAHSSSLRALLSTLEVRIPAEVAALPGVEVRRDGAALGRGAYFLSSALGKKSDSNGDCTGNLCGDTGYSARTSAVAKGNAATLFGVAGGALVAGGVTLFVVGRTRKRDQEGVRASGGLALSASPTAMGASYSVKF